MTDADLEIKRNMKIALAITLAIFVLEFAGAYFSNSLALLGDAFHDFSDFFSLAATLAAIWLAARPASKKRTFGYHRFEVFASLLNGFLLVLAGLYMLYQAYLRYLHPGQVNAVELTAIALVGLAGNAWIALKLKDSENLSVNSAYVHIASDALAGVGVIIGGIAIYFTGLYVIDTIISVIVAAIILFSAYKISKVSVGILLESTPQGISVDKIHSAACGVEGVLGVHDVHVWCVCNEMNFTTLHVVVDAKTDLNQAEKIRENISIELKKLGISHETVQFETPEKACESELSCDIQHKDEPAGHQH